MKTNLSFSISTIFFLILFTVTGCKKEPEADTDKSVILTSHIWRFTDLSSTSTNTDVQTTVTVLKALMTNATISFSINGSYTMVILGESGNGTWEFNTAETSIIMDKGTEDEYEEIIVSLTSSNLELKENIEDPVFGNYSVTYKWIK